MYLVQGEDESRLFYRIIRGLNDRKLEITGFSLFIHIDDVIPGILLVLGIGNILESKAFCGEQSKKL